MTDKHNITFGKKQSTYLQKMKATLLISRAAFSLVMCIDVFPS